MANYRRLPDEDFERYWALDSYAFSEQRRLDRYTPEVRDCLRGLYVGETLAAQVELIPLTLSHGAAEVAVGGIGGVAVAPAFRRQGFAERLMREACAEQRASGLAFSVLFPFSRAYYGRFGYITAAERRVYRGSPRLLRSFKPSGSWVDAGPRDIGELDHIYRQALRGRFGPVVRDQAWWQAEVLQTWQGERLHAHIWYDEEGRGRSYLVYRFNYRNKPSQTEIREMVALDPEARAQLFAFLAGHETQTEEIVFRAPADAPVNLLFPDPLACSVEPHFMLRVLDVEAAIRALRYPANLQGELRLALHDEWMTENDGRYAVTFADGHAEVRRLADDAPVELSLDVRVLAQLLTRYLRPRTAAAFGMLEVYERAGLALAEHAFAGLAPFMSDYF